MAGARRATAWVERRRGEILHGISELGDSVIRRSRWRGLHRAAPPEDCATRTRHGRAYAVREEPKKKEKKGLPLGSGQKKSLKTCRYEKLAVGVAEIAEVFAAFVAAEFAFRAVVLGQFFFRVGVRITRSEHGVARGDSEQLYAEARDSVESL